MNHKVRMLCILPEGSISTTQITQLEPAIEALYQRHFGEHYRLIPVWVTVPQQQIYLAGELSQTASAQLPVEDGLPNPQRHAFMAEFCDVWMSITGCNKNQIIVSAQDRRYTQSYMTRVNQRFRRSMRLLTQCRLISRLILSKLRRGHFMMSTNITG